jgi:long-chain acyl-CoA synthetase
VSAPGGAPLLQLSRGRPYLHPRRVWFVPEKPPAGTNKIDRHALAKRAAELLGTS